MPRPRSFMHSRNRHLDAVCTVLPYWTVNVARQNGTGRYFAQVGRSVYMREDMRAMDDFLRTIFTIDPSQATPFYIRAGTVRVRRNGSGQQLVIKGTVPASEFDYDTINDVANRNIKGSISPLETPLREASPVVAEEHLNGFPRRDEAETYFLCGLSRDTSHPADVRMRQREAALRRNRRRFELRAAR